MIKLCDWSKEKAQEEYNNVCNEYFTLSEKTDILPREKERKARLFIKMELLQAVHFDNPFGKKLCKVCNNNFVAGYIGNGVVLKDICVNCYRRQDTENVLKKASFNHRHAAKS